MEDMAMVVMAMEGMAAIEDMVDMVMGAIAEGTMAKDLPTLKLMLTHTMEAMVAMAIEVMAMEVMEDTVDMVAMDTVDATMVKHD